MVVILLAAILIVSLQVSNVRVSGSDRYSAGEIEELLFSGRWEKNFTYAYFSDRFRPHRQIPFVEDYKVVFHSPWDVEVIIYEKSIVGYVSSMSSYMYFDRDGIVVESSGTQLEGVPMITGLEFGQVVLYRPLPVKEDGIFGTILNLTQQLAAYDLDVDRIQYDEHGQATLWLDQMEVSLGKGVDLDGKISALRDILKDQPQLTQERGVLKLENYTESNSGKGITFKRK